MLDADYYQAHAVHPQLWAGIQGAWLPSLGNTGAWVPDQAGCGAGPAVGLGGTANDHFWATNSSARGGTQLVAQGDESASYWLAPFRLSRVRQATISLWAGARRVSSGTPNTTTALRYLFTWADPATWNTAWGMRYPTNIWLDGNWRGSDSTTYSTTLSHYALTWGPGRLLTVYYSGAVLHSHTMSGSEPSVATEATHIAIGNGFSGLGGCAWDDLRTYSRALSPSEIRLLAERPGIAYEMTPRRMGYTAAAAATGFVGRKTFSRMVP